MRPEEMRAIALTQAVAYAGASSVSFSTRALFDTVQLFEAYLQAGPAAAEATMEAQHLARLRETTARPGFRESQMRTAGEFIQLNEQTR